MSNSSAFTRWGAQVMRFLGIATWIVSASWLQAADKCQELSDLVGGAAIAKPAMVAAVKKNPEKGPLGEPWRLLLFVDTQKLDALGIPFARQQEIYKTIGALNFSTNQEVNYDIFREYYYLDCRRRARGLSSVPLGSISPSSLVGCWNSVANRSQFQQCVEKFMESSKAPASSKR